MTTPSSAGRATTAPDTPSVLPPWLPRIHREGWPFVAVAAVVSLVLALIAAPLGWLGVLATLGVALFFRDPERMTPVADDLVIAAADGVVTSVGPALPPPELALDGQPRLRISTFLSVLDVHINRLPVSGTVARVAYHPGTFVSAELDKASEQNERNSLVIATPSDGDVVVVQIAGLIARRIRCWMRAGETAETGRRFGLIRFGSRVDVYLPLQAVALVAPGQRAVGGETVIADLTGREAPRHAERR
ncbi:MAG: phosphatidylserine decarboxylase [Rhodospirillales bacterium]|jgi:phosphatidylserine decarboxylase|nr:phosphatidylserine decarboxylase [Rhodospirillales bacterium]